MTVLKQFVTAEVNQAGYDESGNRDAVTCFGLPGYGNLKPSMSSCHFTVGVAVYDDESVYVGIAGQISDPVVAAEDYTSRLVVSPTAFTWGAGGTPSAGKVFADKTVDASDGSASRAPGWAAGQTAYQASADPNPSYEYGWFIWDLTAPGPVPQDAKPGAGSGYAYIGQLSEFGASSSGENGVVYIGGTGTYQVTNPVYPVPVQVEVPGFVTPAVVTDYYPFAIRKSGAMASANRTGGCTRIRKSGEWRDVKNNDSGAKVQGCIRQGGAWAKAPKF